MSNLTVQSTTQIQTTAPTTRQTAVAQPATQPLKPMARDGYDSSSGKMGKAEPTTSLKNFSFSNLAHGVGAVAAGGALVIGSAALISMSTKATRAAAGNIAKDIAAHPGQYAKALGPRGGNNTMLYIGLGVTALFVGIYACQKHNK